MTRSIPLVVALAVVFLAGSANGHNEVAHGSNPLGCNPAGGESCYYAVVDDFHANPSTTDSMGEVFLALNSERTELRYRIILDDLLGLKPNPADRTDLDDILGMHLHEHVPDAIGPHVLNIFGLATPSLYGEEDHDLVIDYENHTLSGIYDIRDATIDPDTGEPYPSFFFATTKVINVGLNVLDQDNLVLAVHTVESGFSNFAIHGHIHSVVPEPSTGFLCVLGGLLTWSTRRNASRLDVRCSTAVPNRIVE